MKISIENGVPKVQLLASEQKALETVRGLCVELGKWLGDEQAKAVEPELGVLIEKYKATPEPAATPEPVPVAA